MATLIHQNGHAQAASSWYTETVRDFFSAIPWTGQPLPKAWTHQGTDDASEQETLDLSLSVHAFFDHFAWDGKPKIAVPMAPLEVQPDLPPLENDLTLDGFADLF